MAKGLIILVLVLVLGIFCSAELGEGWDSFNGSDSTNSSADVGVETGGLGVAEVGYGEDGLEYTLEFYIALGVGGFGILIVVVFLYFFFRRPKNRWKKKAKK